MIDIVKSISNVDALIEIKEYKDTKHIAYIHIGNGKYKAYAPLSPDWEEGLYIDKNQDKRIEHQICDVVVENCDIIDENKLKKAITVQICNQIDRQARCKDINVQELKTDIENRELYKIETLDTDLAKIAKNFYGKFLSKERAFRKYNKYVESSKKKIITYDILEDEGYHVYIPLEMEACEQWEVDYPLEVEISALSIKDDEDGFESKLRDALWDQLCSEYFEQRESDKLDEAEDELRSELDDMPIGKVGEEYYIDEKNANKLAMAFSAAMIIMYLRGEIGEIRRLYADLDYAKVKFAEFGIPLRFAELFKK